MQKHLFALFFLAFVLTKSSAIDLSQEFSLDAEPQRSSFLGLDDEPGEVSSFSLDLFNVTDLFDASAVLDSVQGMVEPIGQGIESVGQQIDAAFDGLQDALQDMVSSIQGPLNEQIDVVWTWVSGDEAQPMKIELGESPSRVRAEEEGISIDDQYVLEITVSDDVEVKVIEEREAQYDENGYSERDEIEVIMFQEDPVEIVETVETPVAVSVSVEMPVSVPIGDIDEIVVLVDYTDIAAAMNNPNTTSESIEKELFYVRFFEAYMGKEIELELKSANLSPVEESNKKSQVLSYDAL